MKEIVQLVKQKKIETLEKKQELEDQIDASVKVTQVLSEKLEDILDTLEEFDNCIDD